MSEEQSPYIVEGSDGHDAVCPDCGKLCDAFAGNACLWPIPLPDRDYPGKIRHHHMGCVSGKLAKLSEQAERIEELEARLEIGSVWKLAADGETLERFDIPQDQRDAFPDGITARDETIKMLYAAIERKDATITQLTQLLKEAGEVILPFAEWTRRKIGEPDEFALEDHFCVLAALDDCGRQDFQVNWSEFKASMAFAEKLKDFVSCSHPGCADKSVSPSALQSGLNAEEFKDVVFQAWLKNMKDDGHDGDRKMFDEDWIDWETTLPHRKRFKRVGGVISQVEFILDILRISYPSALQTSSERDA